MSVSVSGSSSGSGPTRVEEEPLEVRLANAWAKHEHEKRNLLEIVTALLSENEANRPTASSLLTKPFFRAHTPVVSHFPLYWESYGRGPTLIDVTESMRVFVLEFLNATSVWQDPLTR